MTNDAILLTVLITAATLSFGLLWTIAGRAIREERRITNANRAAAIRHQAEQNENGAV